MLIAVRVFVLICVSSATEMFQAFKDVNASYDALADLLESIERFLARLDIYTKVPPTPAMSDIIVKIMVELLSTFALVTKQIKEKRSSELIIPDTFRYVSHLNST